MGGLIWFTSGLTGLKPVNLVMYLRKRARERVERESRENSRIGIIDKARRDDEFELC